MSRVLALLALPLLLLGGCAAETRYRIASFLFDGVPQPAEAHGRQPREAQPPAAPPPAPGPEAPTVAPPAAKPEAGKPPGAAVESGSTHKPYGERSCSSCHDPAASNRLRREGNALCLGCHPAILTGKKVVHSPVSAECLLCHRPHSSENVRLLQQPLPDLCLMCHAQAEMLSVHGEIGQCLSCHNPHESDEDKLLEFK